jgi:hypothetical protein
MAVVMRRCRYFSEVSHLKLAAYEHPTDRQRLLAWVIARFYSMSSDMRREEMSSLIKH